MSVVKTNSSLSTKILLCLLGMAFALGVMVLGSLPAYASDDQPLATQGLQAQAAGDVYVANTGKQAYAVFDGGKLTFYCDESMGTRGGTTYSIPNIITTASDLGWRSKAKSITSVEFDSSFAEARPGSTAYWFADCVKLSSITGLSNLNTSQTTSMEKMFYDCDALSELDLSVLNTENVVNMQSLLNNCNELTSVTFGGSFKTAKVTDMAEMFYYCKKLKSVDLSSFNTPELKDMTRMFDGCTLLEGVTFGEGFNTANVTSMESLFYDCAELSSLNLASFNTASVTKMQNMFRGCKKLSAITYGSYFNTASVTNMSSMYQDCALLSTVPVSGFNTQNVTDMQHMFYGCSNLASLTFGEHFTTENVTLMNQMFYGCSSLTALDLSSFNTSKVTSFVGMFGSCSNLDTLTLGDDFDTAAATDMQQMFLGCDALKSVKLGSKFSFKGNNITPFSYTVNGNLQMFTDWAVLPTPSTVSPYVGKWWKTSGGTQYTPVEMQSLTGAAVAGTWTWAIPRYFTAAIGGTTSFTYNGKMQVPQVTVKDKESGAVLVAGTHYTVGYEKGGKAVASPVEAGSYTVYVTGRGVYAEMTKTPTGAFTINPAKVAPAPSTTPTSQAAALEPITIAKVPASLKAKASKSKVTVSWKKIKKTKKTKALLAKIKSVQVQYSTDKSFATGVVNKKVGKNKTKSVLKLKNKTTYYVRARYVGADGVSNWSKVKKVKTK